MVVMVEIVAVNLGCKCKWQQAVVTAIAVVGSKSC